MRISSIHTFCEGEKRFARVNVNIGGEMVAVDLPASSLVSLGSFRRAFLDASGVLFFDEGYEGRHGSTFFRDDVAFLIADGRRQAVSP